MVYLNWIFDLWRQTRYARKEILIGAPDFRHIGISEAVRILDGNTAPDIDGDVFVDGKVSRYFDMRLGIIEKYGTVRA